MSETFSNDGSSLSRAASPLCTPEYAGGPDQLRPVIPPWWMTLGLFVSAVLVVACAALVLLSGMDEYVSASGEVRPADFELVYSRANGVLASVHIADRDRVQKGQVLARLDPWEAKQNVTNLEGEIAQAQAELELAQATTRKINAAPVPPEFLFSAVDVERQEDIQSIQQSYLQRLQDLQKKGAASGTELLDLRLQIVASESLLKRSQQANALFTGAYGDAAREEAQAREKIATSRLQTLETKKAFLLEDLSRLDIVAQESGIILSTARRFPGEKIAIGEPLFKITSDEASALRLWASEDRINLIAPGQTVRFRANNNPDRLAPFAKGRVTEVAIDRDLGASAEDDARPSTYRVAVAIENMPYPLALGATVNAEIIIARRPFWRLLFLKAAEKK